MAGKTPSETWKESITVKSSTVAIRYPRKKPRVINKDQQKEGKLPKGWIKVKDARLVYCNVQEKKENNDQQSSKQKL